MQAPPTNLCSVARAVQAVLQQPAHVFVTCLVIFWRQFDEYSSSWWSVEIRLSPVNQCHTCSSTFTRGNLRQHYFQRLQRLRRRVQLWPCVCLVFLRDPPRTLGFPDCPLLVSAHPVLMSAFSVSRRHTSLETLVHIFWRQNTLHLFTSCLAHSPGSSHPPLFSPQCHPSHKPSSSCSSWCIGSSHFLLHVTCSFVFSNNPAYLPCILCFLLLFPCLQLLIVLSQLFLYCSGNLVYPRSCLLHVLDCVARVDTSVSMRAYAFSFHPHSDLSRSGDRPYTRVDESWSSFITRSQPKHAQICHYCLVSGMAVILVTHFILVFTSDASSCTK